MAKHYIKKEIGWLSFNERILQEACNPEVPLGDRIRFLGIYSSNLDEFFRVRVANLKRIYAARRRKNAASATELEEVLHNVHKIVKKQRTWFDDIFTQLSEELRSKHIYILNERQLDENQRNYVYNYFENKVRPKIFPMMINKAYRIPKLKDNSLYLAVKLSKENSERHRYSIIEIPKKILPRFITLPSTKPGHKYIILIDDVVRIGLPSIYKMLHYDEFEAYNIKVTCDATLMIDDSELNLSYVDKLSKSLKMRPRGNIVRFVYDKAIPDDMLALIVKKLRVNRDDVFTSPGGPYHYLSDLTSFEKIVSIEHTDLPQPIPHPRLHGRNKLFEVIAAGDVLLHFPYHSYEAVIDLLREASIDPKVESIKITLYRVGRHSSIVNALMNARRNRKKVTVILELRARFDEKANIYWADKLVSENVKVIFGIEGLKVHSKLCLITRTEAGKTRYYSILGTGNFNEDTAKLYTDSYIMTANQKLGREVAQLFKSLQTSYNIGSYRHLVVSPIHTRGVMLRNIQREAENARYGKRAFIYIKVNNLSDYELINNLYKASNAGVDIRLIVRSMFSVVTGVPGVSENIKALGIVDKYLEHARYYIFCNNGDTQVYISSADLLPRNIDERVEVSCPVYDEEHKKEIMKIFELQWRDTVKARVLDAELKNEIQQGDEKLRSQDAIYEYLKERSDSFNPG